MKPTIIGLSLALLGLAACQEKKPAAAAAPPAAVVSRQTAEGTVLTLRGDELFAFSKGELRDQAAPTLEKLADQIRHAKSRQLIIRAYTDDNGDDNNNALLSQKQAQAVADWLRGREVLVPAEVQGMGEANPVAPNAKPDGSADPGGQAQNRRVEVVLQ